MESKCGGFCKVELWRSLVRPLDSVATTLKLERAMWLAPGSHSRIKKMGLTFYSTAYYLELVLDTWKFEILAVLDHKKKPLILAAQSTK